MDSTAEIQYNQFYHPVKIGSLQLEGNLFLAPVAGYSDCAFRFLCRNGGANFAYTEMVSTEALIRDSGKTNILLERAPNETSYAVQIFGGNEESMAKAAQMVVERTNCEVIDINAGCPVPKIVKTGAGSSLTRDPERLYSITRAVVEAVQVPVTVKIRSGWDDSRISFLQAAEAALNAGAQAITLHPRTRAQGYEGKAKKEYLTQLVDFVAGRVPVFASGDIFSPDDVLQTIRQTGVDGVMFARGAMGNPFIFEETRRYLLTGEEYKTPPAERIKAGLAELDILAEKIGELPACREMRKRFCAYSKGLENGAQMRSQIVSSCTKEDYRTVFAAFIS